MEEFEVLAAGKTSMLVFWVLTSCGIVGRYQRFGGAYSLRLQGRRTAHSPYGVTTQKTNVDKMEAAHINFSITLFQPSEWFAFLFRIKKISVSNIGPKTGYLIDFSSFISVPRAKLWNSTSE
jgi:hypothetical protein